MKIGIISDIHGNLKALNQALKLLKQHHVDQILCAGDLVDFGDENDVVVEKIAKLNIPTVQGNHDRRAGEYQRIRQQNMGNTSNIRLLQQDTIDFLDALPAKIEFTVAEHQILMTHANPWASNAYIFPDSPLALFRRVAREAQSDIVILGHTHAPMWIVIDGCHIINPGSVSANYQLNFNTCGILTLSEIQFELLNLYTGRIVEPEKVELESR